MPVITISIDDKAKKVLDKRAKKNMMTLREQVEDIVRRSAVNTSNNSSASEKLDDTLVSVFSRKGRK